MPGCTQSELYLGPGRWDRLPETPLLSAAARKIPLPPFRKEGDWGVFSWFPGVPEGHLFGKSGEFQPPMEFARNVG